jgi:hypothetical protein
MSSYLVYISDHGLQRNQFSRLSSDIVRLICNHLCSVADIVAFARACKFNYRAIAPLFTIERNVGAGGRDCWKGLCVTVLGCVAPIELLSVRGGSIRYMQYGAVVADAAGDDRYFTHMNRLKRVLAQPAFTVINNECIYGPFTSRYIRIGPSEISVDIALRIQRDDAKYMLHEVQKMMTMANEFAYKRRRVTIDDGEPVW